MMPQLMPVTQYYIGFAAKVQTRCCTSALRRATTLVTSQWLANDLANEDVMKTAGTTKNEGPQVASDQPVTYSIAQAAKRLKRSESMTKKYKGTLLAAWVIHTEKVTNEAGSLTEEGFQELLVVQSHYKAGNPDGYAPDLYLRRHDLFSDLATDPANDLGSDQAEPDVIDADFVPDGEEVREETAIAVSATTRQMGRAQRTLVSGITAARGRLYAMVRAEFDPVVAEALTDSFTDALQTVGAIADPTPQG